MKQNVKFVKKDKKSLVKIKIIERLDNIAILHVNIEAQHTVYLI